jgi:hypothetical protein
MQVDRGVTQVLEDVGYLQFRVDSFLHDFRTQYINKQVNFK